MEESESREIELSGHEAEIARESLDRHEAKAPDVEQETITDLEAAFASEASDDRLTVSLTRAEARVLIAALEEREVRARGREEERALELRERFATTFDFEQRDVSMDAEAPTTYPARRP
ncbi:hypothetical protein EFA46_006505 [Halarchaeum sp. CBA1220]|uniref:hypothetical protein n=1 Tax=Halarchaeum sp. CBA1220 TaxID=1853682 RepID=UPI000F3A99EB|nr:hypothetical protein [Halarchaeum sp. CBA1220]QLC33864.1 hypothetical protein EFA46_006505 [Halarchaeum sp. CBA1220]